MSQTGTGEPFAPAIDVRVPLGTFPAFQDYPRLVFNAPYFNQNPLAQMLEPAVTEAALTIIPQLLANSTALQIAIDARIDQRAVLRTGSTMLGPLFAHTLFPLPSPLGDFQFVTKGYVDLMAAGGGIPEVPGFPPDEVWARALGAWIPVSEILSGGVGGFLSLGGGTMHGPIHMDGQRIDALAPLPALPHGAAPAQWVIDLIDGRGFITGPHLSAALNDYMPRTGGAFTGPVTLHGAGTSGSHPITLDQLNSRLAGLEGGQGGGIAEPGAGHWLRSPGAWVAGMPASGGVFTGPITLAGNAAGASMQPVSMLQLEALLAALNTGGEGPDLTGLMPKSGGAFSGAVTLHANALTDLGAVPLQQVRSEIAAGGFINNTALTTALGAYVPRAGGTLTGALVLAGDATGNLNPVSLQQLNTRLQGYVSSSALAAYLLLAGGTMVGHILLVGNATNNLNPVPLQQLNTRLNSYLPLTGGRLSGDLTVDTEVWCQGIAVGTGGLYFPSYLPDNTSHGFEFGWNGSTSTFTVRIDRASVTPAQRIAIGDYLPIAGGVMLGDIDMAGFAAPDADRNSYSLNFHGPPNSYYMHTSANGWFGILNNLAGLGFWLLLPPGNDHNTAQAWMDGRFGCDGPVGSYTVQDGLQAYSPGSSYQRVKTTNGVRGWSAGVVPDGTYAISDENVKLHRLDITPNGTLIAYNEMTLVGLMRAMSGINCGSNGIRYGGLPHQIAFFWNGYQLRVIVDGQDVGAMSTY